MKLRNENMFYDLNMVMQIAKCSLKIELRSAQSLRRK